MADHRIGTCEKCGAEGKEIAAHELCFACYRAERRAKERGSGSLMRALHRQPAQLISNYTGLMLAVATVDATEEGHSSLVAWINERIEPLIEPVKHYIPGKPCALESVPSAIKR